MGTFFRSNSDDSVVLARKNSEHNPSPLSQQPTGEEEVGEGGQQQQQQSTTHDQKTAGSAVYESQISFTMDTICPWTYLAKKRLDIALERFRAGPLAKEVNFTIKFLPFQLYPDFSMTGEDKYEWYKREKYNDSDEQMKKYTTLMSAYGVGVGIDFKFGGEIANTLHAHRLIQHYQEEDPEPRPFPASPSADSTTASTSATTTTANLILMSLYTQYFEQSLHPSSPTTLLRAALAAGIGPQEAEAFVGDEYEGLPETKMLMQEQRANGVDSVPLVVVEGRRRDFTLQGAKEVDEYLAALEGVVKELN